MFEFWDWVGGRYSLWSAIGLSIALAIGMDRFEEFLAGGYAMDDHFLECAVGGQYAGRAGPARHLVFPISSAPSPMPSCLTTSICGASPPISSSWTWRATASSSTSTANGSTTTPVRIVFGEPGTNGQHAFYQLIHQGTRLIPADFIAPVETRNPIGQHHPILLSNFFAQTEALMMGKTKRRGFGSELKSAGLSKMRP